MNADHGHPTWCAGRSPRVASPPRNIPPTCCAWGHLGACNALATHEAMGHVTDHPDTPRSFFCSVHADRYDGVPLTPEEIAEITAEGPPCCLCGNPAPSWSSPICTTCKNDDGQGPQLEVVR